MLSVPLNKGDFYETHVVGPQPADIFRGELLYLLFTIFVGGEWL